MSYGQISIFTILGCNLTEKYDQISKKVNPQNLCQIDFLPNRTWVMAKFGYVCTYRRKTQPYLSWGEELNIISTWVPLMQSFIFSYNFKKPTDLRLIICSICSSSTWQAFEFYGGIFILIILKIHVFEQFTATKTTKTPKKHIFSYDILWRIRKETTPLMVFVRHPWLSPCQMWVGLFDSSLYDLGLKLSSAHELLRIFTISSILSWGSFYPVP